MKRILIVDDELEIREILRELLEDLGEVVCVENGALALDRLDQAHFDLVISDYNMPTLNGMQLLKKMNERNLKTPLIWITGRSTKELVVDAWKEGVFDYIEKPFDLEQVRKSVITALSMETGNEDGEEHDSPGQSGFHLTLELRGLWYDRVRARATELNMTLESYVISLIKKDFNGG